MISVGELKDICEKIEQEYGSDVNVILQVYSHQANQGRELIYAAYVADVAHDKAGNLFLANEDFK